jgi:Astacin (Peptidase family M12A)
MRHFEFFRSPGMTLLFRPKAVAVVFCLFFFNKTPANRYRWPGGVVPFVIDPNVPRPERIYNAIHQWAELTPIRLVPRTRESNYVRFVRENNDGLCFSSIGMIGGEQKVRTDDRCEAGTLVHEIGHTVGLWHEQSRQDRDRYVKVLYQNISKRSARDFDRRLNDEPEFSPYDYASIMHYGAYADCIESGAPSIETIPPGIPIGQRKALSLGDIDAVRHMYGLPPKSVTIATHVSGLKIIVDGVTYTAPQRFDWQPGSKHTLDVPASQTQGDTQFDFGRWNDDGEVSHTISVSADRTIYTANFVTRENSQVAKRD